MFETTHFTEELTNTISREAANNGMERYETGIVGFLQTLAINNESILLQEELRKSASLRRGTPDALQSTKLLVETAARFAQADKRSTLSLSDMQRAWEVNFCRIWPFCR